MEMKRTRVKLLSSKNGGNFSAIQWFAGSIYEHPPSDRDLPEARSVGRGASALGFRAESVKAGRCILGFLASF